MRVGLLTQWFDPEPGPAALPGVLARGLRDRGHDVTVVTGFPNYPTGRLAPGYRMRPVLDERRDGVRVRRVALYPSHDGSTARRLLTYASFGLSATLGGVGALRGLDAVWVNASPITVGWPMWAARYGLRVPAVAHVLDLWPDTVFAGGFGTHPAVARPARAAMDAWCKAIYRSAASVAYISPGVGGVLRERGVPASKLHYVPMWADEDVFFPSNADLRAELGIADDAVVLLYAGTLGHAQGLDALVDACARVDDPRLVCLVAGSGVAEQALRERARSAGAGAVRFLGRVAPERMTALMATADAAYIGLSTHPLSDVTMPSKTQATLAAGKAVVAAAGGDVARVVAESGAGLLAEPGDAGSIADAIARAAALGRAGLADLGARARRYYEVTFSIERGVSAVEELLTRAADTRGRR